MAELEVWTRSDRSDRVHLTKVSVKRSMVTDRIQVHQKQERERKTVPTIAQPHPRCNTKDHRRHPGGGRLAAGHLEDRPSQLHRREAGYPRLHQHTLKYIEPNPDGARRETNQGRKSEHVKHFANVVAIKAISANIITHLLARNGRMGLVA